MEDAKLHVVMIPWLAFGHMIPFLELSKGLAKRGHQVSFVSTPRNIERLPPIPPNLSHLITLIPLTPPRPIDGLPDHAQATTDVPLDQNDLLFELLDGLEVPFLNFLRDQGPPPDWIIYDTVVNWAPNVARSLGIQSAFFSVLSAATRCFVGPPSVLLERARQASNMSPEQLMVPPPWVNTPSKVAFRYHEAVKQIKIFSQGSSQRSFGYRLGSSLQGCNLLAIRTSIDFEPDSLRLLSDLYQKPVIPVGFLPPSPPPAPSHEEESSNIHHEEINWLDTHIKSASVVYVAFGSELILSQDQVTELALGLEMSQLPFLWALKGEAALLPIGFQERIKGRGIVRMGWAPQPMFLAHPSIGAFLTHCGWSSTIEGLSFGKPLVMLPFIADQGLITRLMEEKKVGVEVYRNEMDGSFTRDAVAKALRLVLIEKEGECIRENARKMQNIFGDKGSHDKHLDEFVQGLTEHRHGKKARLPTED